MTKGKERPLGQVPATVFALLGVALVLQVALGLTRPAPAAHAERLPAPPRPHVLQIVAGDEPLLAAKVLMLWLQAFDNQPGLSVPFAKLDYERVRGWLDAILGLDPRARYPLLAASRVYTLVPDRERIRLMLSFVRERFEQAPDRRWPWMAHAVLVARHRLEDKALAANLARSLTRHATGAGVPPWARDMSILLLADLGEVESARVLMGGLIESGRLTDAHEIWFLSRRLHEAGSVPPPAALGGQQPATPDAGLE